MSRVFKKNGAKRGHNDIGERVKALAEVKEAIEKAENELSDYDAKIATLLLNMSNVLHESVVYGKDETENVEVKKWGDTDKKVAMGQRGYWTWVAVLADTQSTCPRTVLTFTDSTCQRPA